MVKVLPALGLVIVVALIMLFSPFFKVKTVQIGQSANCLDQKTADANIKGQNIFFINSTQLALSITKAYDCSQNITVTKKYPSTIAIQVETTQPIVLVDGHDLGLTENGQFLKITNKGNKPTIFLPQTVSVAENQKVKDQSVLFALKIAAGLQKSDFIPTNIRMTEDNSIAVYSNQEFVVTFSTQKDVAGQIDSLQAILAKAKINASKISKIDLRFDKPVIVYVTS